ncbi:MAG TPA: hypothetical protein VL244_16055 [Alphaproteobacteria bacterium]|nr:hypothetical protein [Alphaproteobacteria bacterium]
MAQIGTTRRLDRWMQALASDRHSFAVAFLSVLTFDLYWYGAFLSFPLLGEDAAALYSTLLETIRDGHLATVGFPLVWPVGLGQPNLFVTFTFDPFAWMMLLPIEPPDAFRLSMALRASVGWLTSYWFVLVLFRGRRSIALLAATLYLLINFILTSAWGIPAFAGIYNATHAALFPLLPTLALRVMRSRRWLGVADFGLLVSLIFFLLDYPVGSLIGTPVFLLFACVAMLSGRPAERRTALWGFAKIAVLMTLVLSAPPLHVLASWSALLQGSARVVFSDELFAYGNAHLPPLMWTRTPTALRLCILVALSVLLFNRRWPRSLRTAAATLALVVGGVQFAALVKYLGLDAGLVDRLPRLHYFEFYTPLFYAACGGFALYGWRDLLFPCLAGGRRLLSWLRGAVLFFPMAFVVLPVGAVVVGIYALFAVIARAKGEPAHSGWISLPPRRRLAARAAVVALVLLAIATWLPPGAAILPIFTAYARCESGILWCRDPAGLTMGAADNPLTRYLRQALGRGGPFAGRAETLVRPPVRFGIPANADLSWTPTLFERMHAWYARAYEALAIKTAPDGALFPWPPREMNWDRRPYLRDALAEFVHGDLPYYGPMQEDLILEIHQWIEEHGREFHLHATDLDDPWYAVPSAQALGEERMAAFFATGNGLLLRALPFEGIPVASAYEQALGYLYYLLWTRYVDAGVAATKTINTTTLEVLHPERLALLGVRYLVARDSATYEAPPLERLTGWHGYSIYAVRAPNLAGYAVKGLAFGATLAQELRLMREHGFHPRDTAVLPASEKSAFASAAAHELGTLATSSLNLAPNELTFSARSAGGASLVVLPFNWSHCWNAEWRKGAGRLVRADIGLIGVAFAGEIELHLRWTAGYGAGRGCLVEDRALIAEAKQAAADVGFARGYEPLGKDFPPFATARPRFAADAVDELALEKGSVYSSGDEVVLPKRAATLMSADELHGRAWSPLASSALRRSDEGYELAASNGGGASLVVLPLPYSSCWQADWQGAAGALVRVDADRLGVLFRAAASLRLRRPREDAQSNCALRDRARTAVYEFLGGDSGKFAAARYRLGDVIAFGAGGNVEPFLAQGWDQAEPWGRWSLGSNAALALRVELPPVGDLVLDASVGALLAGSRHFARAKVAVNGVDVAEWQFRPEDTPGRRQAVVPRELVADTGMMVVEFKVDEPLSPAELGVSLDVRHLGLSMQSLSVRPAGAG